MFDEISLSTEQLHSYLDDELVGDAVALLNGIILPTSVPLFKDDLLPANQRNLTDVRTRIGILLEFEFALAVSSVLSPSSPLQGMFMTYVVANQFPDLAFRDSAGRIGIRFEVKAIQATAEEKSANFSTMIKDVRKGTDFVVVLLWEWKRHQSNNSSYPHIEAHFVMDAYQLAQMRDCHWLNTPPNGLTETRQGFDLEYGVNANANGYNREEGNFGKLMRIFQDKHECFLDESVLHGLTLQTYRLFAETATRLGLLHVGRQIAERATQDGGQCQPISDALPTCYLLECAKGTFVIIGSRRMPAKQEALGIMKQYAASNVMVMNEKFSWKVYDQSWDSIGEGNKPAQASEWFESA